MLETFYGILAIYCVFGFFLVGFWVTTIFIKETVKSIASTAIKFALWAYELGKKSAGSKE